MHRAVCGTARHTKFVPTRPTLPQLRASRDEGGDYGTGTLAGEHSLRGSSDFFPITPETSSRLPTQM